MKKIIKEIIPYIIIVIVVILIRSYIIDPVIVSGDSMYDTLKDGEVLLLNRLDYKFNKINRYDIVVINNKEDDIIKRVIGLPGEHIKYKYGNLYVSNDSRRIGLIDKKNIKGSTSIRIWPITRFGKVKIEKYDN